MPVALAGLILPLLSSIGVTSLIGAAAAGVLASALGYGLILGVGFAVAMLFAPKQPKPSDVQTVIRQAAAPRWRTFGRYKTSGVLMFANTEHGYLHRVIAMGQGEIDAVEEHWIDDTLIELDGAGEVTTAKYIDGGTPRVIVETRMGDASPAVYADLVTAFPANWTSAHQGKGIVSAYMRLRQVGASKFAAMFPNAANTIYRQVQRGVKVYDPNNIAHDIDDDSTWEWSENAAQIILNELIHPDGLGLETRWITAAIDTWEAASDVADEAVTLKAGGTVARYIIGTRRFFDERPADVLGRMMQACDAQIYPTAARGLAIRLGGWTDPTVIIDDDAIIAYSGFGRGRDLISSANTVRAQYTSRLHDYRETDADQWIDAADVADRGELAVDMQLFAVPNHSQARRLMKLAAHRANPTWTGHLVCNLAGLAVLGERFITVRSDELGIDETFEIVDEPEFLIEEGSVLRGIQFSISALDASAYAWDAATEEGTAPEVPAALVPENTLPDPTGLDVTISARDFGTGLQPIAVGTWDAAPEDFFDVEARGKLAADSTWFALPVDNDTFETGPLVDGADYEFEIRFVSVTGRVSNWTAPFALTATADTVAPGVITNLSATPGVGTVDLTWKAPNSANFHHANVYRNTANDFGTSALVSTQYGGASASQAFGDSALSAGTYYYWITAANGSGVESAETASGAQIVT